ncbi:hypothetical protein FA15DRAFT_705892 [Coprinopsis marcescibilis]|uniref:DUF6533 domain-containing protein n=1 Tax=Coprinopsis marcescibilis TaxID=230819 RepID=A0A5C3KRV2_COPMA|nr:hypothetical protein FA15DRAFT_705892 [Coprinopsis marcescibilis]
MDQRIDTSEMESQYLSMFFSVVSALISITFLLAEYFQTLEMEVALIWPTAWGRTKVLYFVARFLPFLTTPVTVYYNLVTNPTPSSCQFMFSIGYAVGAFICAAVAELVVYARIYALAGRRKTVFWFLFANSVIVFVGGISLVALHAVSGSWHPSQFAPTVPGCFSDLPVNATLVVSAFAILLYSNLLTMCISVYYGLRVFWALRHRFLIRIFYRDGTFYFTGSAALSITNAVLALMLPPRYRFLFTLPQVVMHSTLSTRMILHLREGAKRDETLPTIHV